MANVFQPDFEGECRLCGTSPTVIVVGHKQPETDLCGKCFFNSQSMTDWNEWNDSESDDDTDPLES